MRRLGIVLVRLLILALVVGAVGCGGGEALSPETREIRDFLNDKHVNELLWEEWNIFDEWILALSTYESSSQLYEDWEKLWYREQALWSRAVENRDAILAIDPPEELTAFWDEISEAVDYFCQAFDPSIALPGPMHRYLKNEALTSHADGWLELRQVCTQQGINMEWPLPRTLP